MVQASSIPSARSHRKLLVGLAIGLGVSAVTALFVAPFVRLFRQWPSEINPVQIALTYAVVAIAAACLLASFAVSGSGSRASVVLQRIVLVLLVFPGPAALLVSYRLAIKSCTGMNFLFLPWPEAIHSLVQVIALFALIGSIAALVVGYLRKELRATAIVMSAYLVLCAVPVLFMMFLSIYGDPGYDCNPV